MKQFWVHLKPNFLRPPEGGGIFAPKFLSNSFLNKLIPMAKGGKNEEKQSCFP